VATYLLPELPCAHAALEPAVWGRIMELHHDQHHAACVAGANATPQRRRER
jgi:superoxide dismutase, Fe-Mn family